MHIQWILSNLINTKNYFIICIISYETALSQFVFMHTYTQYIYVNIIDWWLWFDMYIIFSSIHKPQYISLSLSLNIINAHAQKYLGNDFSKYCSF